MQDLFGPSLSGFTLIDDLLPCDEEQALVDRCLALSLAPFRFQGWEGKRLTHSFGWHYDFDAASLFRAEPIPDWLLPVRDSAARALGRDPAAFEQALVIRYDPGAGIGWHRDRPHFGEVIGVSLASPATLAFRRRRTDGKFDRLKFEVAPRSAYLIAGEARRGWQHGIATHDALRFSLTFRSLA